GGPLGGKTGFAGISQLEPGHWLTWRDGQLSIRRYWDVRYRYEDPKRDAELLAELAWVVDDAVRIHSRSDVPLGCHLSGGLDSSAVASHATRPVRPLTTFPIGFRDGRYYDESEHGRAVAAHIGATHVEEFGQPDDLGGLLPALIYHMDFGLPAEGAFGYFAVSRLARRHVKVALTGHGGGDCLAACPEYVDIFFGSPPLLPIPGLPRVAASRRAR